MPRKRRPPRPGALAELSPLKIATQIVLLQLSYYVSAAVLLLFTALVAGQPVRLDLLLSWETVRADTTVGWMVGLVWMLNGLVTVVPILLLIARSKLVPDFACTIHFFHLVGTTLYTHSIPSRLSWWALQAASCALMSSLGIWACRWRELKPIAFGGKGAAAQGTTTAGAGAENGDEEEGGVSRGRGRGRGRDGQGEYEMVGVAAGERPG